MRTSTSKHAFTLTEAIMAILIISVIVVFMITVIKPESIRYDAYKKASLNSLIHIDLISKKILMNHSPNHSMLSLKNLSNTAFNLSNTNKNLYMSELYANYSRKQNKTADSTYTNLDLKNVSGTAVGSFKVSSFSNGIFIKNGTYIAFKLNANCTTTETNTIYNPSVPDNHTKTNSCGLIFFDSNGMEGPNILGIDMNIVSIGKFGIK